MSRLCAIILCTLALAFGIMSDSQAKEGWNDTEILIRSKITACSEAIAAQPQNAVVWRKRAEVWYMVREYKKAMQDTQQALKLDPKSAEAYSLRAALYEEKGDNENALRDLNQALKSNPDFVRGYAQRSALYYRLDQEEASLADLKNMVNVRYGEDIGLYAPQILSLRMQKNFERFAAIQPAQKKLVADLFPARAVPFFIRGNSGLDYMLPLALPTPPEYTVGAEPPQTEAEILRRGSLLLLSGARDKAILWFNLALQMNPKNADAYYNRGIAYASSYFYGKNSVFLKPEKMFFIWREKALQDLRQAISLRPEFAEAHYALGELYADGGNDSKANLSFDTAVHYLPNLRNGQVLRTYRQKGTIGVQHLYQTKHLTDQLKPYDQKIKNKPRNADALFTRALYSRKLGIYDDLDDYRFLHGLQLAPNRTDMFMDFIKHSMRFLLSPSEQRIDRILLDHVLKLEPKHAEAYYRRGLMTLCGDLLPQRDEFTTLNKKDNRDLFYLALRQSDATAIADFSQAAALEPGNGTYQRAKEAALQQKTRRQQQQSNPPVNEARDFSQDKTYVKYVDIYDTVEKAMTAKVYTAELASHMNRNIFDRINYRHSAAMSFDHKNEEPDGIYYLLKQTGERADLQNPQIAYIDMTFSFEIAYVSGHVFFPQQNISFTVAFDDTSWKIIGYREYKSPRVTWLRSLHEISPTEMKLLQKTGK